MNGKFIRVEATSSCVPSNCLLDPFNIDPRSAIRVGDRRRALRPDLRRRRFAIADQANVAQTARGAGAVEWWGQVSPH